MHRLGLMTTDGKFLYEHFLVVKLWLLPAKFVKCNSLLFDVVG